MTKTFGAEQTPFPSNLSRLIYDLGFMSVSGSQLFILSVRVRLDGRAASVRDPHPIRHGDAGDVGESPGCGILGINVDHGHPGDIRRGVGAGRRSPGVLVGLNFNAISPFMGIDMGIKGMAVMLIGGLGSIYGAMVGGLLLGIIEVFSVAYLESSLRDAFAFGLMILDPDRAAAAACSRPASATER